MQLTAAQLLQLHRQCTCRRGADLQSPVDKVQLLMPNLDLLRLGLFALTFIAAAAAVFLAIPRLMPLFQRYALSRPNARSSHKTPTPQGGGAAVSCAVVVAVAGALVSDAVPMLRGVEQYYLLAMAAVVALALLGAADDMRPLPAIGRLFLQMVLVGLVVFGAPETWRLADALPLAIERAGIVVAGVWFVNLTNFMDGIDGIVVAEFVPMGVVMALLAALGVLSPAAGIAGAALAGGLAGFSPFNRHPAKLFLGDVGSLPIGLVAATILFELAARGEVAAALLLPLYFLFDATETLIKGLLGGHNVLAAHRRHAYQNAVDAGVPAPVVTARVLGLNLLLAVLALASIVAESLLADVLLLFIGLNATILLTRRFRIGRA